MKLIKELGPKEIITKSGKKIKEKFGIFECKYCSNHVEKNIRYGIKQKSCGSKECKRKAHSDGYNRQLSANNRGNRKDGRASNNPRLYSRIKNQFCNLNDNAKRFFNNSFDEFYSEMYGKLVAAIKEYGDTKFAIIKSRDSYIYTPTEVANNNELENIDYSFSSLAIAEIYNKRIDVANKLIKKYLHKVGRTFTKDIIPRRHGKNTVILRMDEETYNIVNNIFASNHSKRSSNFLYIIKSSLGDYKVGITSNPQKRINEIRSHSSQFVSYDIELLFEFGLKSARKEEAHLHKKFSERRLGGEWFSLNDEDIEYIVNKYKNHHIKIDCT